MAGRDGSLDEKPVAEIEMMFGNEPMRTGGQLRELLIYDPRTGVFRWRVTRRGTKRDNIAGTTTRKGRLIRIDGRLYQAGRLAWLYMKGTWPNRLINCINGNPSDIRWANLRQITLARRQASRPAKNRLGVKGVWKTGHGKYAAEIRVDREKRYLGQFDTLEEASGAYAKAATKAFGSFARAR